MKVLGNGLLDAFSTGNFNVLTDLFSAGIMGGLFVLIEKLARGMSSITSVFKGLEWGLDALYMKEKAEAIMDIAKAVLMLAGAALILSLIDSNKLLASVGAIAFWSAS